jgi:hypothetical protein
MTRRGRKATGLDNFNKDSHSRITIHVSPSVGILSNPHLARFPDGSDDDYVDENQALAFSARQPAICDSLSFSLCSEVTASGGGTFDRRRLAVLGNRRSIWNERSFRPPASSG